MSELRSVEREVSNLSAKYEQNRQKVETFLQRTEIGPIRKLRHLPSIVDLKESTSKEVASNEQSQSANGVVESGAILASLEELQRDVESLAPKIDKLRKRTTEKDPITNAPRYGEKTMKRVVEVLELYDAVSQGINIAFGNEHEGKIGTFAHDVSGNDTNGKTALCEGNNNGGVVGIVRSVLQKEEAEQEQLRRKQEETARKMQAEQFEEQTRVERERIRSEEEAILARQREEADLHRRAQVARREREEAEHIAAEEALAADRAFVASITKGADGVREQLLILRENLFVADPTAHSTALGALHTLFTQISSHPEEVKFRRIRRDHPKFMSDIGRHPGGKELLIAAGFRLVTVDAVPCFFSKEPDIEHDMDGWSEWFDLIKNTVEIIEEELLKG